LHRTVLPHGLVGSTTYVWCHVTVLPLPHHIPVVGSTMHMPVPRLDGTTYTFLVLQLHTKLTFSPHTPQPPPRYLSAFCSSHTFCAHDCLHAFTYAGGSVYRFTIRARITFTTVLPHYAIAVTVLRGLLRCARLRYLGSFRVERYATTVDWRLLTPGRTPLRFFTYSCMRTTLRFYRTLRYVYQLPRSAFTFDFKLCCLAVTAVTRLHRLVWLRLPLPVATTRGYTFRVSLPIYGPTRLFIYCSIATFYVCARFVHGLFLPTSFIRHGWVYSLRVPYTPRLPFVVLRCTPRSLLRYSCCLHTPPRLPPPLRLRYAVTAHYGRYRVNARLTFG